jgi:DNA-binding beta-propeller fold protein YncE
MIREGFVGVTPEGVNALVLTYPGIAEISLTTGAIESVALKRTKNLGTFVFSSTGRYLFGTVHLEPLKDWTCEVVRTDTKKIGKLVRFGRVPNCAGILAIAPGNTAAYVVDADGGAVSSFDLKTGRVTDVVQVPEGVSALAMSPTGHVLYVAGSSGSQSNTGTDEYITPITTTNDVTLSPLVVQNRSLRTLVVLPNDQDLLVTTGCCTARRSAHHQAAIVEIAIASGRVVNTNHVDEGAFSVSVR